MARPLLIIALLGADHGRAEAPVIVSSTSDQVAVTLYRAPQRDPQEAMDLDWLEGYALITETRSVDLPAGTVTVRFEGVAGGMLPESALVTGLPEGVREQNLDADLLSPASLYARSTGRPVTLRRTDERSGRATEERAVIRSGPGGAAVVQTRDGFLAVDCGPQTEELVFTELPPGLSARPTLSVAFDSPVAQRVTLTLSYLAWGFDWQSNYVIALEGSGKAVMTAWVTLASSDPISFPDAETALVAGIVNREDDREYAYETDTELYFTCFSIPFPGAFAAPGVGPTADQQARVEEIIVSGALRSAVPAAVTVAEEALGDLRLYRVPMTTTVAANAQKQVALFDPKRVDVWIVHAVRVDEDDADDVEIQLRTRNRPQQGLGLALPGGPVAVFERHQGELVLVGEGGLADRAVGEDVEIPIATPAQVTFDAEQVDAGRDWVDFSYVATNANPWPVTFEALLTHHPERRLSRASSRLGRKDGYPMWRIVIPANGLAKLRFRLKHVQT